MGKITLVVVYYYGCNCGKLGSQIMKVETWANKNSLEFQSLNGKDSEEIRNQHKEYLSRVSPTIDRYLPIVIYNDEVILLSDWKQDG